MSVLVYIENTEGRFKKSTFEIISFASAIASKINVPLVALSIGKISEEELQKAAQYGASKILNCDVDLNTSLNPQSNASIIAEAAKNEQAKIVVMTAGFSGKNIAPRVAIKLEAALAENVIELPVIDNTFIVKKGAFSGKAFCFIELTAEIKVISMLPNSFKVISTPVQAQILSFKPIRNEKDFTAQIIETKMSSNKVSLPEAELVVSAGRGMKGPENWGMIEELANILGAATACSKPVSDAGWRPHSEHVGQTGIAISPNLYIAVGISGAIQHLAGVSSSKVIVVINKDPEAPFFKAADYGIVGDAFEIVPELIKSAKAFKANQN